MKNIAIASRSTCRPIPRAVTKRSRRLETSSAFWERHPHIAGVAEAMKKQDGGRSFAAEANVLRAVRHRHCFAANA